MLYTELCDYGRRDNVMQTNMDGSVSLCETSSHAV